MDLGSVLQWTKSSDEERRKSNSLASTAEASEYDQFVSHCAQNIHTSSKLSATLNLSNRLAMTLSSPKSCYFRSYIMFAITSACSICKMSCVQHTRSTRNLRQTLLTNCQLQAATGEMPRKMNRSSAPLVAIIETAESLESSAPNAGLQLIDLGRSGSSKSRTRSGKLRRRSEDAGAGKRKDPPKVDLGRIVEKEERSTGGVEARMYKV